MLRYQILSIEKQETKESFSAFHASFLEEFKDELAAAFKRKVDADARARANMGNMSEADGQGAVPKMSPLFERAGDLQETESAVIRTADGPTDCAESDGPGPSDAQAPNAQASNASESMFWKAIRGVYRKLARVYHPDKRGGSKALFQKVNKLWTKRSALRLLSMAQAVGVELDFVTKDNLDILELDVTGISRKIAGMKSSLVWRWSEASDAERAELRGKIAARLASGGK
jgi:hypothetical protein